VLKLKKKSFRRQRVNSNEMQALQESTPYWVHITDQALRPVSVWSVK